ncbi:MAG: cysteine synthase family protein [Chloroflexota bacterium]|nr:cysteine synthase family protein [Chloroflexota bacterium]
MFGSDTAGDTLVLPTSRGQRLTDLVGNTPLLRLRSLEPQAGIEIYGKAEWFNPGGSVKDRAALAMIETGERSGALTAETVILDATSGNTGIAYAMIGAARGYRVMLCVPGTASEERKQILRAHGVELVFTDPAEGSDGAIRKVRELYAANPDAYFYPDQYNNPENWRAHFRGTGVELWQQTGGRITHFLAGLGTSGTFVGTTRRLKLYNADIQAISVQPDSPFNGLEGLKHMETAIVPGIYDGCLADRDERIETEAAYAMVRRVAREEGILIGISGGAALAVAERVAGEVAANETAVIVAILPDSGNRYLSERFWSEG